MIDPDNEYAIDGRTLHDLFKISERFNDGERLSANERRDLAQAMQAKLRKAWPIYKQRQA